MILHLRNRTSLHRRCRLNNRPSNRRQEHRLRRRRLLPQRRRPQLPHPWLLRPSRERPITTLLPQPRIIHHQNGRLVVSGEERVVDNSWLIIFSPFFLSPRVFMSSLIVRVVRVRPKFHLRNLFVLLLLSQSQCPLSSTCSYPAFYRRLYSSSILVLVLPSLSFLVSSPTPPCPYCVFSAVLCWSSPGYVRAAVSPLFIPFVLYNHRITSDHIHLTSFLQISFPLFFLKTHGRTPIDSTPRFEDAGCQYFNRGGVFLELLSG